jgi:N-acetylglucosamine kinase-like BadF-type ATPase
MNYELFYYFCTMILIADSGSTKTDWALQSADGFAQFHTQGINPFHQERTVIAEILSRELLPQLDADAVSSVCFYGSGVRPELEDVMASLLQAAFPQAKQVSAHSDLLGAARALCGHNYGIASILGTGANSCLYDGKAIVQNTPALGYILGDEGSGGVLGKHFLHELYKGVLSKDIRSEFEREYGLTMADVIQRVYREPMPNRFLASLAPFIHRHLSDDAVKQIVINNFRDFFRYNIRPYGHPEMPVSFVGSIAWHFRAQLAEAAKLEGFAVGTILRSPIEGLIEYHQNNII